MVAEPIHMVQEDEAGDCALVFSKKSFDRIGTNRELIEQAIAKFLEVLRLEIFRATRWGVGSGDVDSPEVVVLDGQFGKDRIDRVFDELDDPAGVLIVDLFALGFGDPHHVDAPGRGSNDASRLQRWWVN